MKLGSVVQDKNISDSDNVVLLLSPLGERNSPWEEDDNVKSEHEPLTVEKKS